MNAYPALQAKMGDWTYYIVKMTMREVAKEVEFARDVHEDYTLSDAIQRELKSKRVTDFIVPYLKRRPDRFFSAIVIAAFGGSPKFIGVDITRDEKFELIASQNIGEAFGVLTFDGRQKYYALDGQHRLAAIKMLLDRSDPISDGAPDTFPDEEISVIVVLNRDKSVEEFRESYRRLFSSLNRYAKSTDPDTNIIMDEDDSFAILTRRLISEHEFFRAPGKQKESFRVKTKGKPLNTKDGHFTSLQTLYAMNETLLNASWRENDGWGSGEVKEKKIAQFKLFAPDDEYLESLYDELVLYWDGILGEIPELRNEPLKMRVHDVRGEQEGEVTDHLLFWPIGQELLATVVRRLLDRRLGESARTPDDSSVASGLKGLGALEWDLHEPPWRYFLLTAAEKAEKITWKMRSEDRKDALRDGENILMWQLGELDLKGDEVEELKLNWETRLIPARTQEEQNEMWDRVKSKRSEISKIVAG